MKKSNLFISIKATISVLILAITNSVTGQGVSISNSYTSPDSSAILDIESKAKGILLPRMNTLERNAIINPTQSLLIFNTDSLCFQTFVDDF